MSQITLVFGDRAGDRAGASVACCSTLWAGARFSGLLLALVVALLTWASERLPETLPVSARQSLLPRHLWRNYVNVLRRPEFLLLAVDPRAELRGFFLYIASAPAFLMDLLGVSSYGFAWLFMPDDHRGDDRRVYLRAHAGMITPRRTIGLGYILMFIGVAIDLVVAAFVPPGVPWHVLPIMIFASGRASSCRPPRYCCSIFFQRCAAWRRPCRVSCNSSWPPSMQERSRRLLARSLHVLRPGYGGLYGVEPDAVDYIPATYPIARGCGMMTNIETSWTAADHLACAATGYCAAASCRRWSSRINGHRVTRKLRDAATRTVGLMHRFSLRPGPRDAVRIRRPQPLTFWMRDTTCRCRSHSSAPMVASSTSRTWRRGPKVRIRSRGLALLCPRDEERLVRRFAASQAGDRVDGLEKAPKGEGLNRRSADRVS